MPILPEEALAFEMPQLVKVRQKFDATEIVDIETAVLQEINQPAIAGMIKPGAKVAIAVGSRGISNIARMVKTLGRRIRELGGQPFVVAAMGSHGGGTAEGQQGVLASLGVTEAAMGIPVVCSMEVVNIGKTDDGVPVYMDKVAYNADMVVLVARVKPHTDFKGDFESGLCKMMAIGLGKHIGCSRLHQEGFDCFSTLLPAVAKVFIAKARIGFGLAVLENAYDKTYSIKAVRASEFLAEEPNLLAAAKKLMPRIMLPTIDVLIVEQIGKDISGAGMDPNIIGRTTKGKLPSFNGPTIQRIVVLDLSEATHGNACGIGLADFITKSTFAKLDYLSTYANVIASANPEAGRIPVVMETEKEAVIAAVRCCSKIDISRPRIVRIKDTLSLEYIWISANLCPEVATNPDVEIIGPATAK